MAPLTIRSVTARPVLAPLPRLLRTASGAIPAAPLLLLDVETHQGVTGRAYVFGYTPTVLTPLRAFVDNLAELLVGRPVAPADRAEQLALAFRLLGLVDPVKDRKLLEASVEAGFRAIKIKVGEGSDSEDAEMVAGVRDVVGPEVRLMVDLNQSQSAAGAIRRIQRLAGYDLAWVEEPVAAEDLAGHARVRSASPVPIQTGENWWFPWDMAHAIEAGACDLAMPDLMKIGGVTGWLRAMGLAESASLPLSSHIFVEASAHVLAVSPTAHYLEYMDLAGAARGWGWTGTRTPSPATATALPPEGSAFRPAVNRHLEVGAVVTLAG